MSTTAFTLLNPLCNEVLTLIEADEAKLLNWGFFDVRSDLKTHIGDIVKRLPISSLGLWDDAQQDGITVDDILENLVQRKLIFKLNIAGNVFYRTRFAETIRLLSLLRQRFSFADWQTASRLVSDLKIQLQRRRYPKRDIEPKELISELRGLHVSQLYIEAVQCLLQDAHGENFQLARFQKEAVLQLIRNLRSYGERALTIGAGTGSGKTKAFYIPALAEIADSMTPEYWVKALALYPRVELLKDQLAETFSEARKVDDLLLKNGRRMIALGAYYADTPASAKQFLAFPPENWLLNNAKDGWICPFFFCPNCHSHDLTWYRQDVEQEAKDNQRERYGKYARLRCPICDFEVKSDQLLLTREQMIKQPPDILFTTTEMLNRRLSRAAEHQLFGIDVASKSPRLVLLDEIHTYEGLPGAQVAYLLRRWKYARSARTHANLCFVGLSATLTNAEVFFSKLTGVPEHRVGYIFPRDEDLEDEGIEYNVVVKGDPVSGTSLLSTSVQTVMLLGRILDSAKSPSAGAYGKKIFAFTDKLDVINRWYHIEREAETIKTLSQFRDQNPKLDSDARRRCYQMGQDWSVCKQIGHDLRAPLRLELTSSQYRGVNSNANLVIATSTLEVGFNDPEVGVVVQHKAPRSLASFLQRKGRSGRTRQMRPWMVVVTSAYGRDRWAFQHTENLFNPHLESINLPLDNYYVRKIQATYALMDWLAFVLKHEKGYHDADVWDLLSSDDKGRDRRLYRLRSSVRELLEGVLHGARREHLQEYLRCALGIQERETVLSLLWGEPRSLLFEVIPTLLRQLESDWQCVRYGVRELWADNISPYPMPDFVPPNLFSDLNLPELLLRIPDKPPNSKAQNDPTAIMRKDEYMPLLQALNEFAPGHVSKRYSRKHLIKEAHWLELPEEAQLSRGMLPLQYLKMDRFEVPKVLTVNDIEYQVFQPRAYTLGLVPENVKNTSSAHLIWRSYFEPKSQRTFDSPGQIERRSAEEIEAESLARQLTLTPNSPWHRFFRRISSYTQAKGSWVEVTRLATGVRVETRYNGGAEIRRTLLFEESGQPAALGFTIYTDALRFEVEPLDVQQVVMNSAWPTLYQHLGPEYFLYKLQHDVRLAESKLSSFEIGWLWQLELSMLVAVAVTRQCNLREAAQEVKADREHLAERAMKVIFQSQQVEEDDEEDKVGRLHQKLMGYIADRVVQDALNDNEAVLWDQGDQGLHAWLHSCHMSSLGAVLFTALVQLLPDIDADDLVMDVEGDSIWISETTAGGVGLLSRIADAIALRPREFDLQMFDTLQHCDREQLAEQLRTIAHLVDQSDAALSSAFGKVRDVADLPRQLETRQELASILEARGVPATRELIVALNAKFLRPNSSPDTDKLIATLVRLWQQEEERIGCAIDLRVMAVAALRIPEIKEQVGEVLERIGGSQARTDASQIFNLLQSLLWLNCHDSCPDCIEVQQPYQELARPSRALLLTLLYPHAQSIVYGMPGWKEHVQRELASAYHVQISCEQDHLEDCKRSLLDILIEPIEIGFQFFFPAVERLARTGRQWIINMSIRELMYA
jgi:hypothetical protein